MNCDGVRGLLSAFVDGELSAGEQLHVEQHLRRCHACADEVDALRQTVALLASLDEIEVPETFSLQLHNRLVALGPPMKVASTATVLAPRKPARRSWAVPAAAAAAAFTIGLTALNHVPGALQHLRVAQDPPGTAGSAVGSLTNPSGDVGGSTSGTDTSSGPDTSTTPSPEPPPNQVVEEPVSPPEVGTQAHAPEEPGGNQPPATGGTGGQNNNANGGTTPVGGTSGMGVTATNPVQPQERTVPRGIYTSTIISVHGSATAELELRALLAQRYNQVVAPAATSLTVRVSQDRLAAEINWLQDQGLNRFRTETVDRSEQLMALEDGVDSAEARLLQSQRALATVTDESERRLFEQELTAARTDLERAINSLEAAQAELEQVTITIRLTGSN